MCHKWKSTVQVTEYSGAEAGEHDKIVGNKEFIKSIIELISWYNTNMGHVQLVIDGWFINDYLLSWV